ncbi:uncharacterized protein LOC120115398 isoform X5 [Hibiscus syriacus]|uniref:uncharacterized protein LOC120115398 isoform X5 n=1 Tax=Hibiscus syriacus TaxID=106335 RepID=UPI001921BCCA|nr:uncharacterized protein LOC120115398 isoform X5 [Hibiscus syriacus]
MSTVGLDLTSPMDPDLTWKIVSKRKRSMMRRTRRPVAKILMLGMVLADKNARTVERVMVSESEKVGVDVLGRRFCERVENAPIKKRRFVFRYPSPPPPLTPYLHLEASEQHVDFIPASNQNFGSNTEQGQQLMKSNCSAKSYIASVGDKKISEVINGVEDFSGIEILAAAACSDSICNDVTEYEGNPLVEEPTVERMQSSASSTHLEEITASLEAACSFRKDSVNESRSQGSSFQDNSFAVLHEFPSDKDTEPESLVPLPDNRSLWDLNVSVDAWLCDGGTVDTQKDSFANISGRSEELQITKPQDIKNETLNEEVSSDVDGGDKMTSDLRTMPVETDDLSTEKQESEGCSGYDSKSHLQIQEPLDIKDDTTDKVVSFDVVGDNRMASDLGTFPVGTDDLSEEKQECEGCSGFDSHLQTKKPQDIKNVATYGVVSSEVDGVNMMTSDLRTIPVGSDDSSTEKQECEGCPRYDLHLQTKEPQDTKDDTTNKVVSSDVDGGNRMTSDERTMPVGTDDLSTEKPGSEGCSGYDSQFEDGELRESDVQYWEEAEQGDYDAEFEEERSFGLEAESGEQELKVERGSNMELTANFKSCESGEALRKNSVSLKIRTVEVSDGESMKIDCLDGSNYDLRVDISKVSKRELLSCVEGSFSSDVHQRSRFDSFNASYPRAGRGAGSEKSAGSDGSCSHIRGRSPRGAHVFSPSANYWDSKRRHPPISDFPDNIGRPRPKCVFGNREYLTGTDQIPSEAAGTARPGHRISRQFMSSYRSPVRRRSPTERVDSYSMHPRIPTVRDTSPDRSRFRRHPQGDSRGIRDEYLRHIPDDSTQYLSRMPHCLDRRGSISPHGGRHHHTIPYKRARSRSRSRSPIGWLSRDRNEGSRRHNRSPDFRSEARMDRVRLPLTKRFGAVHGEFISPPRSQVSPQRNYRMFEDRNPGLDYLRGRKSYARMQDHRYDQARPIRRLNPNDYFDPTIQRRRFLDRAAGSKGCKYEVSDDGKHGSRYAMIHRVRCYDTDGGARRLQYNEEDSYMAKNSLTVTNATGVSSSCPEDADAPRTASEHW